jgi:electron-transferring-flavoprotein dehydrogenase
MIRDSMTVDIVCVGAGVASLSAVLRLMKRVRESSGEIPRVLVLEKGRAVGAHVLSGAILDPEPLADLLSEKEREGMPVESVVVSEGFYYLTEEKALRLPWIPPPMCNKGLPLISLSIFAQYLGQLCESAGVEIHTGFTATELIQSNGRVVGIRVGDKGVDKQGIRKSNYEPGPDVFAKVVILGEGACGILTEQLIEERKMANGRNPQSYALGIKELIEVPPLSGRAGAIFHTFGYPLESRAYGGGFLYGLNDRQFALGLVTALDYRDATLNPHDLFRAFKAHPRIQRMINGGKIIGYGAKIIPEGGFHAVPDLAADGVMIVGDGAGLLDSLRLKGIHIAMQSGIAAGDTLFDGWKKNEFSPSVLRDYPKRFHSMSGWRQMKRVKNVRACFTRGTLAGMTGAGMSVFTNGLLPSGRLKMEADGKAMRRKSESRKFAEGWPTNPDLDLDRLTDVYHSDTHHEENQPCHLKILDPERCVRECFEKYGAPCALFCPAQVYNLTGDGKGIRIDFSNCLHCETCQIKDPLGNIRWTFPEGGDGPRYCGM